MDSLTKLSQCFLCFLLFFYIFFISTSYSSFDMPKLYRFGREIHAKEDTTKTSSIDNTDVKISYYSQTLDHFNYRPESYTTFKQKYMVYSKHWGGAKAMSPILVFFGDEEPMPDNEIDSLILSDYAAQLKALVVVIEHRFYGNSTPFGMSMEQVVKNASIRGYFNSAEAIADYAEVILHLKKSFKAHYSPVIVVGGSYGGMLAAWFRLKYPHVALGALASSAPVLYFDNIISPNNGYFSIVNRDFKEISKSCYDTIKKSWDKIEEIGSKSNGLLLLSKKFKTCTHLSGTDELETFLGSLYTYLAQYKSPSVICNAIDKGSKGRDVLSRISAGVVAFFGNKTCYDTKYWDNLFGETNVGYAWQTCSEMVMPVVPGTSNESMFHPRTFDLESFTERCKSEYNVMPRPHWITTYYGGHDIKLVLKRFGSNIIFSNGLKDPYSSGGVLENLSDSIIAVYTTNGTHCQDILSAKNDDPKWLVDQRRREVEIIEGWIKQYYSDLNDYLKSK